MADTRCGVVDFHPRRIGAFRCPDPGRCAREPLLGVGEPLPQGELAQARIQQRLKGMRQRAAEQFDGLGVDELTQQWAAAVCPQRREVVERSLSLVALANTELPQGITKCRRLHGA